MLSSIHILDCEINDVIESLINLGVSRGLFIEDKDIGTAGPAWVVGVSQLDDDWITVVETSHDPISVASALASELQVFSLAILCESPSMWSFEAYHGNERVARYRWEIPAETISQYQNGINQFEEERLQSLGLTGIKEPKRRKRKRVESSDPRVEMSYRKRVSGGALNIPVPEVDPELPRALHKVTGKSTAAKIRKILTFPYMNVEAAVAEFGFALNLPNWLDECRIDCSRDDNASGFQRTLRMFDKR